MKLSELAEKTFSRIEQGDPAQEITAAAGLDLAREGEITFLANPKYTPQIRETRASAIFLNETAVLDRAIDTIRDRFGRESVGYASVVLHARRSVPDAFRELAERQL